MTAVKPSSKSGDSSPLNRTVQHDAKRTEKVNRRFSQFLNEEMQDGSVRPINSFVAQPLIAGAINAAMDIKQWRKVDNIDEAAIDYSDVFFNGLLPCVTTSKA